MTGNATCDSVVMFLVKTAYSFGFATTKDCVVLLFVTVLFF